MAEASEANPVRNSRHLDGALVVELRDELNLENAPEMRHTLMSLAEENKPARFILDLRNVPYMDSSAIAVFIEVLRKVRTWEGKVVLFGLQKRVQGMVEIARLGKVFAIAADESAAMLA